MNKKKSYKYQHKHTQHAHINCNIHIFTLKQIPNEHVFLCNKANQGKLATMQTHTHEDEIKKNKKREAHHKYCPRIDVIEENCSENRSDCSFHVYFICFPQANDYNSSFGAVNIYIFIRWLHPRTTKCQQFYGHVKQNLRCNHSTKTNPSAHLFFQFHLNDFQTYFFQ